MLMHRLGRMLVRTASLLATLALLAGLPAALVAAVGWPLPRQVPTDWAGWEHVLTASFPDTAVINLLACGLWLVWAAFTWSLLGEIAAARRGRPVRQVRALSPLQALAALLVAGMSAGPAAAATLIVPPAIVTTLTPPAAVAATPPAAHTDTDTLADSPATALRQPVTATTLPAFDSTPTTTTALPRFALAAHSGPLTLTTGGHDYTVTVKRGDTLWDLAQQWLGDPHRWPEIYKLNADRYDEHGRMHGGDHIERGWKLVLPDDAVAPPGAQPTAPPHQPTTSTPKPDTSTAAPATTPPLTTATPRTTTGTASPTASTPHSAPAPASPQQSPPGDRDGVVETTTTPPPASARTASASPFDAAPQPERSRTAQTGVTLASGSWLDLGLAAAIAAAVALVWAHRRRRYTRRPVSPELHLDDPDLLPMPPVVTEIRHRLHTEPEHTDTDTGSRTYTFSFPRRTAADDTESGLDDEPITADTENQEPQDKQATETDEVDQNEAPQQNRPLLPALSNPATVVWPSSGLGLTGPGAEAAARGFLAAALADTDPDAPPGQVVLPSTMAATLLGAAAVTLPNTPRLIVTDDLGDALALLEQQILHRSRLVYAHEVDTVAAMRAVDAYEEPAPPILLIADAGGSHERTRISALLAQGQRLDIHGVLLGEWADGDTIIIDTDGTTTADELGRHGRHPADVGRLAVLTPAETVAVITTLAEAHTGLAQPIPPAQPRTVPQPSDARITTPDSAEPGAVPDDATRTLAALAELGDATAAAIAAHVGVPYPTATAKLVAAEHAGHTETIRTDTGQTLWRLTDAGRAATSIPAEPEEATPAQRDQVAAGTTAEPSNADIGTALRWPDPDTEFTSEPAEQTPVTDTDRRGHIDVTVLGEPAIIATNPDRLPRKKALELLVYLAVHDGSATAEAILDDLLPDAPASKAPERLYTYVSDLRSVMRRIGGPATYLTHPHRRYVLNPDVIDIDLWRMRAALRDAAQASDEQHRVAALRRAVDAYRGPLAAGADYEWAEPYREAIRQQALDAHLALADALTGDPVARVQVLEAAIGHSPYSEHLYQEAMRARAALGHADAIRTLRRALDRALAEIDAEPGDDTITLAEHLLADVQKSGHRTTIKTTSGTT